MRDGSSSSDADRPIAKDMDDAESQLGFRTDLWRSARGIAATPELLVATLAVFGVGTVLDIASRQSHGPARPAFNVAWSVWELMVLGFWGTQRVWFQRHLDLGEVIGLTRRYVWRFVQLGLLLLVPIFTLAMCINVAWTVTGHAPPDPKDWPGWPLIGYFLFLDAALTFVVPALVDATASPVVALRIGKQLIRRTWPQCVWYLVLPGLTLASLARLIPTSSATPIWIGFAVVGPLLALWFRGAIFAFYLRQSPIVLPQARRRRSRPTRPKELTIRQQLKAEAKTRGSRAND